MLTELVSMIINIKKTKKNVAFVCNRFFFCYIDNNGILSPLTSNAVISLRRQAIALLASFTASGAQGALAWASTSSWLEFMKLWLSLQE